MPPRHYFFNHIPKTGGNSLLALCRQNLAPAEISPHLTDPEIRLLAPSRFEGYRLITGHLSILTQIGYCHSRYTMTLLRDPIRRIFSAYTFWRAASEQNPVTVKARDLSFDDFVLYFIDSPSIIYNPYTCHFAAVGKDFPAYPRDSSSLLAVAKNNLAAFNFVGICEEFERSTRLLCHQLGWNPPATFPYENRTFSEHRFTDVNRKTMELLRDRNQLDLELFDYAVKLFHARENQHRQSAGRVPRVTCSPVSVEANRFLPCPAPTVVERRAVIRGVSAEWVADESSRVLEIAVRFRVNKHIPELSVGLQVNDEAGELVWGTSTAHEKRPFHYETAQECRGLFSVQCELPPGLYFVTAALSEPRRLGFHDHWIDHATLFRVMPPRVGVSRYVRGMRTREFSCTSVWDAD